MKQLIEILFQTGHRLRVSLAPAPGQAPVGLSRLALITGMADTVESFFDGWLVSLFHLVQVTCFFASETKRGK